MTPLSPYVSQLIYNFSPLASSLLLSEFESHFVYKFRRCAHVTAFPLRSDGSKLRRAGPVRRTVVPWTARSTFAINLREVDEQITCRPDIAKLVGLTRRIYPTSPLSRATKIRLCVLAGPVLSLAI